MRDVEGANLDRIQLVKGGLDTSGKTRQKVYHVAWAGNRQRGPDGKRPPIDNTVTVREASYDNSIGAPSQISYWSAAAFDPKQRAFYYARVLEIPTPRRKTYDAKAFGVKLPTDVLSSVQDRACPSPIWVTPSPLSGWQRHRSTASAE
jgi:hypothetical protein